MTQYVIKPFEKKSWNQFTVELFSKTFISSNFCSEIAIQKFRNFHTVWHLRRSKAMERKKKKSRYFDLIWRYLPRRKYTQFHEFSVNSFLIISFSHRQFNEISIISMNFLLLVYPIKSTRIFRELNYFFYSREIAINSKIFPSFFIHPISWIFH